MFFTCHSFNKRHIIMVAKITYHGGQIIYVVRKRLWIANTKDLHGSAFGLRSKVTMENFTGVEDCHNGTKEPATRQSKEATPQIQRIPITKAKKLHHKSKESPNMGHHQERNLSQRVTTHKERKQLNKLASIFNTRKRTLYIYIYICKVTLLNSAKIPLPIRTPKTREV